MMEHNWIDDGKGDDDDDDGSCYDDDGSCYDDDGDDDHLSVGDTVRIVDGHHKECMGCIEVKEIMKDEKKRKNRKMISSNSPDSLSVSRLLQYKAGDEQKKKVNRIAAYSKKWT